MIEEKNIRKYHPGVYVKDAIEALEMTAKEFSFRTGISERMLSGLMSGECNITFDLAYKLSEFFGNSVNFWTNLQNQYDAYLELQSAKDAVTEDWQLLKPMKKYLLLLDIIEEGDDPSAIVAKTRREIGVNKLSLLDKKDLLVCFKQHHIHTENCAFYQNFWIALALQEARKQEGTPFQKAELKKHLSSLRKMTTMGPQEFYPKLQEIFARCGVNFVLLPYLAKSNIYGVTKWLTAERVMLSISNRGEKADLFWFTLCHEIAHVLMEHKREALISFEGVEEAKADRMAEDILIPRSAWEVFVEQRCFTASSIQEFAECIEVHPCIVLGRLHKEKCVAYGQLDKRFGLSYKVKLG